MKFTSFAGKSFSSLNVTASMPNDTPDQDRNPNVLERLNGPGLINGIARGVRTIPVYFMVKPGFNVEDTILALIAALDPDDPDARTLGGQLNDGTTNVKISARPGAYLARPGDTKGLLVPFYSDDSRWIATATTTEGPTSFSSSSTTTFTVGGQGRTNPLIKIGWSANRTVDSTTLGWKYRRQITVTNNGSMSLYNHILQLGPFDTAALVTATKMLSNGADLVPFNEKGERLRSWRVGANTRATFLSFVIDELDAGASRTYDIGYGNPSATFVDATDGFPYNYPGSPTIDIYGINGTATAGAASTLSTGLTVDANRFNGSTLLLTGAATAIGGQYRRISSHTTGGVLTVARAFSSAPTTSTTYTVINGPFMGDGGQASATSATTLTDSSQVWNTNEWIGATVEAITLTTGMGTVGVFGTVTSNTGTVLTLSGGWSGSTPSGTTIYRVYKRNANHIYRVDQTDRSQTNLRGRWRLNVGGTRPSQIWFASDGAPHAWSPTVYNPSNAANDYNQLRYTYYDVGGGQYDSFSILNASYQKKDGGSLKEKNFANGVEVTSPLGFLGIREDYKLKNPNGMCRTVRGCRDRGGEDWELYLEDGATLASLTARSTTYTDLTGFGTPYHLLAALTSYGDDDIAKSLNGVANLTDNTVLEVRVDSRNLTVTDIATASEASVYDLTLYIRRSTQASETAGDDVIRIGQNGKHVFLASGEKLWIGKVGDVPLACRIYNGTTFVRDVPWQVRTYHIENNRLGDATRYLSADVLPMQPGSTTMRVQDPDGTMGTVAVEWIYNPSYL